MPTVFKCSCIFELIFYNYFLFLSSLLFTSSQVFVYCVNVKEKTNYILIIAVTDASMMYREIHTYRELAGRKRSVGRLRPVS